jgi:diguanylate cyclase (GGDEF)-like protein
MNPNPSSASMASHSASASASASASTTSAAPRPDDAARIRHLTCFDALTGLPNRLLFSEQLGLVLRLASRNARPVAVLLADLDDFRRIRHSLGHVLGDRFIKTIAERIGACLRSGDVVAGEFGAEATGAVARVGGNEFAIVLSGLGEPHDAQRVAQRLRQAVCAPVSIDGRQVFPTLSIGAALFPRDGNDAQTLLERADMALGQAKEQGKDRVQFYSQSMNTLAADWLDLESSLRRAVAAKEFFPVFQPRIDCRSGEVCGVEALVRWRRPNHGVVAPGVFIAAAEQSRLIAPIGEFMLDAACRQNMHWQRLGLPPVPISVNVSALQVSRPDFVATIARALERSAMPAHWLELEVTESMLMNDAAGALRTFTAVKALGVRIAIDDFGTGFSSLAYLRDFPFDVLKIDRSFVERLPFDTKTAGVTCGIIDLTHRLGLTVVAEGVETQAQSDFLRANGCELMQGFLYSRPLEADALERFWQARTDAIELPAAALG